MGASLMQRRRVSEEVFRYVKLYQQGRKALLGWQLKDYGTEDQIGFNDSYEEYINNLNLVWQECYRVLSDGCRMCINIGDQFARSVYYGRYKVIPIRTEIIRFCESLGMDYM